MVQMVDATLSDIIPRNKSDEGRMSPHSQEKDTCDDLILCALQYNSAFKGSNGYVQESKATSVVRAVEGELPGSD